MTSPLRTSKLYPHITGVRGNDGEDPGVLAVCAELDPSPYYPEDARIIVGSPQKSDAMPGALPDLGGFSTGIAGALAIIATLQQAIADIRAALRPAESQPQPRTGELKDEHLGRLVALAANCLERRKIVLIEAQDLIDLIAEVRRHRAATQGGHHGKED
jgi:hypothetical protein